MRWKLYVERAWPSETAGALQADPPPNLSAKERIDRARLRRDLQQLRTSLTPEDDDGL